MCVCDSVCVPVYLPHGAMARSVSEIVAFSGLTKEEGKDQESIQSSTTRDTICESDKNTRKHQIHDSPDQ